MDSLKIQDAEPLYAQVFLCLRVLLARVSPEHLQGIWPIVLMEIIRTFEESFDPVLLLSACKFIDLALILLPRHFHLYQWCFVSQLAEEGAVEEIYSTVSDRQVQLVDNVEVECKLDNSSFLVVSSPECKLSV